MLDQGRDKRFLALRREGDVRGSVKLTRLHTVATLLNIAGFVFVYFVFPRHQKRFINEDRFLENLTALLFLAAFLLGTVFVAKLRDKRKRQVYSVIPIVGLLGLLDELSYGERLLQIKRLPGLRGIKIDGLHDLVYIAFVAIKEDGSPLFFGLLFVLLALGVFLLLRNRQRVAATTQVLLKRFPALHFLPRAALFLLIALAFDLDLLRTRFLSFVEELTEMNVGLSLLFGAGAIGYEQWRSSRSRTGRVGADSEPAS